MRIQRIDVCGFKSFNQRAVISFEDGVTGIVGPNGCGKSNVVDAIRWVMGEQSAKHLRGRSMEDVIFAGSETQGPSGMAEVSLTLQNDRPNELPVQYQGFSEVTVSRRLYRDGRSEYLINKTACRLLDITELFLGTGVGTRAYSIIEQGRVGLIVNSKPEDRRALLEEAAGITKYKARKRIAERKLEYTEQNLLRVADIVGEMKRQLNNLERQAKKAEKYRQLKNDIRELELHEASARWLELRATLTHLGLARAERTVACEALQGEIQTLEVDQRGAREALLQSEEALEGLRGQGHALALEAQRTEQQREFARQQIGELARQSQQFEEQLLQIEARRGELAVERTTLLDLAATIEEQLRGDQAHAGELEAQLAERVTQEAALRQEVEAAKHTAGEAEKRAASLRVQITANERRRAELTARAEQVQAETREIEDRRAALSPLLEASSGETEKTHQLHLSLTSRKEELEQALLVARAAFAQNETERLALRDALADRRSRLTSLEELQRSLDGHGKGTRSVMLGAEGKPAIAGVRGLLADAFQAPKEIEAALEAYLEARLEDVLVDDVGAALSGAAFLEATQGGRATFWPTAGEVEAPVASSAWEGCLGRAAELVQVAPGAAAVVSRVLGDVWLFQTVEAAQLARAQGLGGDLVTLQGVVLSTRGSLTAGQVEGVSHGALSRRRELDELAHVVAGLEAKLDLAQRRHGELAQHISADESQLKAISQDSQAQAVALANHRQDVRRMTEQLEALSMRSVAVLEEQRSLLAALDEVELDLRAAREGVDDAEQVAERLKAQLTLQATELASLTSAVTSTSDRLTELKVKLAGDAQRANAAREQVESNQRQTDVLRAREEADRGAVAGNRERVTELAELERQSEARLAGLVEETRKVLAGIEAASESRGARTGAVAAADQGLKLARDAYDAVRSELAELNVREREAAMSLGHVVDGVRDRHQVELTLELHRFHLLVAPGPEVKAQIEALREAVERIGEVNLTAIREHEDVLKRHAYLSQQQRDLEHSIAQLREAIVKINRTSRDRLRETFELVNARFSEVFPRLFRGGSAGLVLLEEGGDVLEAGVEIFAQPPGKRLQSVNLLSGGEKALTAVALIFAIFLIKPTPFCLLDEVDAPLDEGNVGRYSDLVKEISKVSQFILITHNKRSMEIADTLYGVTMEEPGCSKIVGVNLKRRESASAAA